ncbi:MAG: hypothetical protein QOD56_1267, partial [Gammaproteobacteria bacterium]|nr:hypothetical protein [Gammaproteobacteria bacterium]
KVHDELSAAEIAYTLRATVVWALFYGLMAVAIAILFFTAPERVWSLFVNFATFGLIAAACLADAAIRHARAAAQAGRRHSHRATPIVDRLRSAVR